MSTSAAKLSIANQALQEIGAAQITDFDDGSTEANPVKLIYDDTRDDFLVDNPWTFARTRTMPVNITYPSETPDAWVTATAYAVGDYVLHSSVNYTCLTAHTSGTFATDLAAGKWTASADALTVNYDNISVVYHLPSDFLALYQISAASSHQIEFTPLNGTKTKCLLSDNANLGIVYIFQNDDPSTYFPAAKKALIKKLSANLTLHLTSSGKTRKDLLVEYETIDLPRAMAKDSQQGTPLQPDQFEWERARFVGTSQIFPPFPGAATWITVWNF